jgi:hypothetical protein
VVVASAALQLSLAPGRVFQVLKRPTRRRPPSSCLQMWSARRKGVPLARTPGERKAVRLFLGPKDLEELSRKQATTEAPRETQSVGRIAEEAEARDGSKGLSRSSAAVSAGYRAAQLAPEVGTAVLEVRTDARGAVTSVSVLGDHVTDAAVERRR